MKAIKLLFSPAYALFPVTVVTVQGEQRTYTNVRLFGVRVQGEQRTYTNVRLFGVLVARIIR